MTTTKIIAAIIIHLLLPLTGLFMFMKLKKKIIADKIINPPIKEIFMLFITYGGLLLIVLTDLFWEWSGAASLGTFYLILGAPFVMGFIAIRQFKNRAISNYHKWTFQLGFLYFIIAPLTLVVEYFFSPNK